MSQRQQILVVGSLNTDLVVRTIRHPQIGETVLGHGFRTYPGGKGANQAVAVARLGCPVKMVGRIGTDSFGEELLARITSEGVEPRFVLRDDEVPSGVAFITVDERGQNTIVVASGANMRLTPDDIDEAADAFNGAAVLLAQLEVPLAAVERAIELARRNGVLVVLNPAPAQLLESHLLHKVDVLIPNQTELALLAGQESTGASIEVLRSMGVKRLVVTLGENGALVVDGDQQEHMLAHRVPVVDTTAAGDAFAGAFAVALSEGQSIHESARWGNAAGALTVTRPGAQPSLPTRQELLDFLQTGKPG
jgi:ribokinase